MNEHSATVPRHEEMTCCLYATCLHLASILPPSCETIRWALVRPQMEVKGDSYELPSTRVSAQALSGCSLSIYVYIKV